MVVDLRATFGSYCLERSSLGEALMNCKDCQEYAKDPAWPGYSAGCPECEKRAKESMNES